MWLGFSENDPQTALLLTLGRKEGPSESGQSQGLPEASFIYLPLCLKNFLAGWRGSVLEESVMEQYQVDEQAGCSMVGSLRRDQAHVAS